MRRQRQMHAALARRDPWLNRRVTHAAEGETPLRAASLNNTTKKPFVPPAHRRLARPPLVAAMKSARALILSGLVVCVGTTARAADPRPFDDVVRDDLQFATAQYGKMLAQLEGKEGTPRSFEKGALKVVKRDRRWPLVRFMRSPARIPCRGRQFGPLTQPGARSRRASRGRLLLRHADRPS